MPYAIGMSDAARKQLHQLVEALPSEALEHARAALGRLQQREHERAQARRKDIATIDAHADELKDEMDDILSYQADW
jgi:uncharacterized protein Yka (UPF0111/DUF47 family)